VIAVPTFDVDVATFRAEREEVMVASDDELRPIVDDALVEYSNGVADWYDPPIDAASVLWWETFEYEQGRAPTATELAEFQSTCAEVLERTSLPSNPPDDTQVEVITGWLSAFALNSATAAGGGRLEWVTRQDGQVRDIHVPLDGETVTGGSTFDVAGHRLHFPGEPVGPPHVWINCRCLVRQVKDPEENVTTNATNTTAAQTYTIELKEPLPSYVTVENGRLVYADSGPGTPAHPEIDDDPGVDDDPGEDDSGEDDEGFYDLADYAELDTEVPWHGIIAPTGVMSGDRRKFAVDALRTRNLPVPLTFQRAQSDGHGGAVTVGNIERVWEEDGLIKAEGRFAAVPEADEAIYLVADRMLQGVSVELDDAAFELQYEDGTAFDLNDDASQPVTVVTDGRVASATLVTVPAFQEAFITLGTWADAEDDALAAGCIPCAAKEMDDLFDSWRTFKISEAAWDGSAARFTDDEYYRSCVLHKNGESKAKSDNSLPILEPNGDLNRAAVHAAAARVDQVDATDEQKASAKRSLLTAYRKLEEDPPESLTAAAFASAPGTHDGPGWATHPKDTQRLRDYWTRGKGAAKIRWGQPGDFNRCRRQLAKYVPNPQYLAGTCANLHKVAMGLWPGQEGGKRRKHAGEVLVAAAFSLVDDVDVNTVPPLAWFQNPGLEGLTPLTIEGRHVYGHLAGWATCHTGFGVSVGDGEVCVRPPNSASGYAYFHTGQVITDDGAVNVGHLTMDTGHAAMSLPGRPAAAHYDNTGAVVADVVVGEDEHGIWYSGALRPDITDNQRIALQAASLSGDWRRLAGKLELVAALCVNVPGFPIPRTTVAASGQAGYALVAAGVVQHADEPDLRAAIRTELALVKAEEARAVQRAAALARVHKMQAERARARLEALR